TVAGIAAADLQRRRPAEARHDLVQECRVAEHLDRELGPADRQHVQADLPTVRIDPADVRELYVAEAARRRILPRIQRIARHAIPVRELETRAVTENADRKSTRLNSSHELKSRMPSSA